MEGKKLKLLVMAAAVTVIATLAFTGGAAAHDDGDGLTVHNETKVLDKHGEIHTITIDKATADTDFYVDLHTDEGTINTTQTFGSGTVKEDLQVVLNPTIKSDTEVNVAIHAANGTELASKKISVDVVEAPTVSFSDRTQELDKHSEIHTITVDTVAADQDYYVDVHTDRGTINTTRLFEGGTAQTDLELVLDPTLKSTSDVTVAVHAENGTELAAQTATVTTAGVQFSNQTRELDEHEEVHTVNVEQVSAGKDYYVDVHTDEGTINTTQTYEAGTVKENLSLVLDPTLKSTSDVSVAVHAADGTEIAAETATVTTADVQFSNQTHELDEHGEIHSITVDKASAGKPYYIDVHTTQGTINTTQTFEAGTVTENLSLALGPTLNSTSEVTVAVHAADGTEMAAETATVTTADVQFSNRTRELDENGEINTITVDRASAGSPYYIDVHTSQGTINKTQTIEAGTTKESFEVALDPAINSDTEVTVAVHATNGTEIAASTAMVEVTERESQTATTEAESQTATTEADDDPGGETSTQKTTGGSGPGFGIAVAVVALIGAVFAGVRYHGN